MKIPLLLSPKKNVLEAYCNIRFSPKNIPLPIRFIVDTGSSETFIDEIDVMRYRVFTKTFPVSNSILIGGNKISLHKIGKTVMAFKNDSGAMEQIEFNDLKIAESARSRQGTMNAGASILGMNFLNESALHLFLDPTNNVAYFGKN
ncbi:MAG: hypothetical protein NT067_06890 [Candidatus Diapherotrites archaeon]|nr:hypothetical protein [Candidatus Diapherotrites archaeon]